MFRFSKKKIGMILVSLAFMFSGLAAIVPAPSASASVPYINNAFDCSWKLGRNWTGSSCASNCLQNAGNIVVADPYNYCSNAASKISSSICAAKARVYQYGVCLKEWSRNKGAGGYTSSCINTSWVYHVANPYDYCSAS